RMALETDTPLIPLSQTGGAASTLFAELARRDARQLDRPDVLATSEDPFNVIADIANIVRRHRSRRIVQLADYEDTGPGSVFRKNILTIRGQPLFEPSMVGWVLARPKALL